MLVKDYMSHHPFMLEEEMTINQIEGQAVRNIRETA